MSPHPRNARNRGLPTGLRERAGYWSWKDPSGKEWGIGRVTRAEAIAQASEAQLKFAGSTAVRLADRIDGTAGRTLEAWMAVFWKRIEERGLAPSSIAFYRTMRRRTMVLLGADSMLERITTRHIVDALRTLQDAGKASMAKSMRSFWGDAFRAAVADGWIATNPVLVTERIKAKVRRARLSLEVFLAVREAQTEAWAANAMNLALITAQRRADISAMQFSGLRGDVLAVRQQKTGMQLEIPLSLRLDAIGLSLDDVIRACRKSNVVSRYLIHDTKRRSRTKLGGKVSGHRIARRFANALRDLGLHTGEGSPPSFHEIRSLAKRLYRKQGNVDTKELLGHTTEESAATYADARGSEWTRVTVLPSGQRAERKRKADSKDQ